MEQAGALQDWVSVSDPIHVAPPFAGAGLVHVLVLVWVPVVPQVVAEQSDQEDQSDHPPFTGPLYIIDFCTSLCVPFE